MYSTSSTLRPRQDLLGAYSSFNWRSRGLVAGQVLPRLDVSEMAGAYTTIPVDVWTQAIDTIRAAKAGTSTADWTTGSDTFQLFEMAHKGMVDNLDQRTFQSLENLEAIEAARVAGVIAIHRERLTAAAVFNTTTFATSGVNRTTLAGGAEWDVAAGTPVLNVAAAKQALEDSYGVAANTLIIPSRAVSRLMISTEFKGRYLANYGNGVLPPIPSVANLQAIFELENIIIPRGRYNTAAPGATPSLSAIWDEDMAMVAYIDSGPDHRMAQLGRTLTLDGGVNGQGDENGVTIDSWESNDPPGVWIRGRQIIQPKLMATPMGHLITNIKA